LAEPPHATKPFAHCQIGETLDTKIRLESLVDAAGDAIIAADTSGKIVLWNPAAERMFGFTAQEALGQTLDLIIPQRFRDRHWSGYRQVMLTGSSKYGTEVLRVPALHRDGRPLSIAFTVGLLPDRDGKTAAIAAIVRDETARWNEEREMRRRLSELEQQLGEAAPK
jgi:PAS domain S-box-containing protein